MEKLTKDELRTLCWMCQNEIAHITRKTSKTGKVEKGDQYQRILSISKKAYEELINGKEN